jgi:uncharacterized YigZ family protein
MIDIDKYYTLAKPETTEIKIKGSKFIGYAFPLINKVEAFSYIEKIRTKHFDATHNCFAYQMWKGNEFKISDDGEPSGTAGKPILSAIKKYNVNDVIVIISRYFGGTKLGVGGLVRAYSEITKLVLEKYKKKIIHITNAVKINCRYEEIAVVKRIINEYAISFNEKYTDAIEIISNIPLSKTDKFINTIISATNTKANATIIM